MKPFIVMAGFGLGAAYISGCTCGEERAPRAASQPQKPARRAEAPGPTEPPLSRTQRALMGTLFEISIVGKRTPKMEQAMKAALDEIERLESVLSEWQPTSEISAINRQSGNGPVRVSADTVNVVEAGLKVSKWSNGAYDLTWAAMHEIYRFTADEQRVPTAEQVSALLPQINWRNVHLDRKASTVELTQKGMAIGTGGIAKGYALDKAAAILKRAGFESFTIFGGGQVQVAGKRGSRAWRVGIQHPRKNAFIAYLESEGGSVSTSGDYEHAFRKSGRLWHHILDPRTGYPAEQSIAVTLLAEKGLYADALSTAVFVLGPKKGLELLKKVPVAAEAVVVEPSLRLDATEALADRLVFREPPNAQRLAQ